jgi:hypothetical protein
LQFSKNWQKQIDERFYLKYVKTGVSTPIFTYLRL